MLPAMQSSAPDPSTPCPFLEATPARCRAAFAGRLFDRNRRARRCHSEDHDNCPLFMAKLLRSSPVERAGTVLNLYLK